MTDFLAATVNVPVWLLIALPFGVMYLVAKK